MARLAIPALVHYEDRMSMAWSRESRLPFLELRLVEMILPLAPEMKLRDRWTKWILRKAMEERPPAQIAWRQDKQTFTNPQRKWPKHDSRGKVSGMLSGEMLHRDQRFRRQQAAAAPPRGLLSATGAQRFPLLQGGLRRTGAGDLGATIRVLSTARRMKGRSRDGHPLR
jgi:asparagine synthetase B (glutamine-hydrolysing)